MWTKQLSIDKQYEREIDYINHRLSDLSAQSLATVSIEESKFRKFFNITLSEEKNNEIVFNSIQEIIDDVIIIYFKSRYLKDELKLPLNVNKNVLFFSATLSFDSNYNLQSTPKINQCKHEDVSIDGLYNFRCEELKGNWKAVSKLCLDNKFHLAIPEIFEDLVKYLLSVNSSEEEEITVSGTEQKEGPSIINKEKPTYIHNIFDNPQSNIIAAITKLNPKKINFKGTNNSELKALFKPFTEIKEIGDREFG